MQDDPTTVRHEKARQISVTAPCVYRRRFLWAPGLRVSILGKFVFFEKPGVQDEWGRHMANRSSDPWVAYPEFTWLRYGT